MGKTGTEKSTSWKFKQVGVVVKDLDKAIEHYQSLGIGPFEPPYLSLPEGKTIRGKPANYKLKISRAMMGQIELELIQPLEPIKGECPHKEFLESKGEGVNHLSFFVDDVDKEVEKLAKQGIAVMQCRKTPTGLTMAYLETDKVGGFLVELVRRRPE